jgi:hypothetical protein
MKTSLVTLAALALLGQAAHAAEPTARLTGLVRIVKSDGKTVIAQATPLLVAANNTATGKLAEITLSDKDAFLATLGRCAFNLQYDEVSATAVTGSTNRIYSNDALIAQNTQITLTPNAVKTIWTQPYLVAGANTVRLVINADSAAPSTGLVRINVTGSCGKVTTPPPPPPVVYIQPGSGDWNNLNTAWGYSNYAVTQLRGKGYAGYDKLVQLNTALTAAISARKVSTTDYATLMAGWNALLADAAFKAAMAKVVPTTGK